MSKSFVVRRNSYGAEQYLALLGPFQYPHWLAEIQGATIMPMWRAYAAADSFGGEAVEVH